MQITRTTPNRLQLIATDILGTAGVLCAAAGFCSFFVLLDVLS